MIVKSQSVSNSSRSGVFKDHLCCQYLVVAAQCPPSAEAGGCPAVHAVKSA